MLGHYLPLLLVILVLLCGAIWLIDKLFFAKKRMKANSKEPWYVSNARSFFPLFLIVLIIRAFLFQPMEVPTGSLEPTILTKEFLVVNMFKYGFRLPVLHAKIFSVTEPKRGDIVVFRFPGKPTVNFIKRLIGAPGDHVVYKDKVLYINGKKMPRAFVKNSTDYGSGNVPVQVWDENLNGVKHQIYLHKRGGATANYDFIVPKKMYFFMGDNRDGSDDSRFWGFVPEKDLVGKAEFIWMSWDSQKHWFRWHRFGKIIK